MAELSKSVLGKVSGTVGDITFRQRRGKNVISVRPKSFMPGDDIPSVERRARFALSAKLAQAINSLAPLRTIWVDETPPDMSPYNYMIGVNFSLVGVNGITNLTTISPSIGFPSEATSIVIATDSVAVVMKPIGTSAGIDATKEPTIRLVSILSLTKPTLPTLDANRFVALMSPEQASVLDTALSFDIVPGSTESQLIANYQEKKALCALITLSPEKNPVRYSNTFQSA